MNQGKDRTAASGLLDDLDHIRSILDDALPDDAIPVLEDAVEIVEPAPALPDGPELDAYATPLDADELETIPVLEDAIPDLAEDDLAEFDDLEPFHEDDAAGVPSFESPAPRVTQAPGPGLVSPGATVAELLAAQELQTAVRNRIDEIFERWTNDTLQQELNLLRARLLEAVRAEVHEFITDQINRDDATGRPHGE